MGGREGVGKKGAESRCVRIVNSSTVSSPSDTYFRGSQTFTFS